VSLRLTSCKQPPADAKAEATQSERDAVAAWSDEEADAALAAELRKKKRRESKTDFEKFLGHRSRAMPERTLSESCASMASNSCIRVPSRTD
jgi:hypothetical protein